MSQLANERVAWFNGNFVPEREVRIPFRDSSWVYGDGCFDMTRTFGHRLFKVKEHVDRLYRSLKYLRIDPGFGPQKMCDLTEEVFERNRHLLGPDDDYWVGQRISRGVKEAPGDNIDYHGPNVLPGVSRQTAIDLARQEGLALREADLDLYDAYNADEIFLTSTSLCICPVTSVNGVAIGPEGQVWGPVTRRIADAYQRFVDHDFVGQYMRRYVEGAEARAF